jgi:multidrug resistance efflux pump
VFCNEIKAYSLTPDQINAYLEKANQTIRDKEQLLLAQQDELQRVQREMERTHRLYQKEKLDEEGISRFFKPLDERRKQLDKDVTRLQAEIDLQGGQHLSWRSCI